MTAAQMANGYRMARAFERANPTQDSLARELRHTIRIRVLNELVDADWARKEAEASGYAASATLAKPRLPF